MYLLGDTATLVFLQLRPVSTQENKRLIGLDFFHLVLSTPPDQNSLKYFNSLSSGLRITGSNWNRKLVYRKPMRGFNFLPIRSDPMLIFS